MAKLQRTDADFLKDLKDCAAVRVGKGLAKPCPKDISVVEMQRLLRRTNGYQQSLEELRTKPKRT